MGPMVRAVVLAAALAVTGGAALAAQAAGQGTSPAFEVASVKPSEPVPAGQPSLSFYGPRPGGQWRAQNMPLMGILRAAYPDFRLPGQIAGPSWIEVERYHVDARASGAPTTAQYEQMLRQLLAERFALQVRTETRELDVYVLVRARSDGRLGPGLRPPVLDCEALEAARKKAIAAGAPPPPPAPPKPGERPECGMLSSSMNGVTGLRASGSPIGSVANILQSTVGRPIIDRTGLTGRYDIDLDYAALTGPLTAADRLDAPASVFTAVQEQLGLKLEPGREPMPVLVIERIERPTPD